MVKTKIKNTFLLKALYAHLILKAGVQSNTCSKTYVHLNSLEYHHLDQIPIKHQILTSSYQNYFES